MDSVQGIGAMFRGHYVTYWYLKNHCPESDTQKYPYREKEISIMW
jgi:hypothetical protein